MIRLSALCAILSLGIIAPCLGATYDVFLLAGQSNMDGRGDKADLVGALAPFAQPQSDVKIFYANPHGAGFFSGGFQSLKPGFSVPPNFAGPLPSDTFGPEVSFGRSLADAIAGHSVVLIKVAEGGTSLAQDWNPDSTSNNNYDFFLQQVNAALGLLSGSGNTVNVRGMFWHQGESDESAGTAAYSAMLRNLIAHVRSDLSSPSLPFVIGELSQVNNAYSQVRAAQHEVADDPSLINVALAGSSGLVTSDTNTHFDASSQITMGQRAALAMISTLPEPGGLGAVIIAGAIALVRRRQQSGNGFNSHLSRRSR